ncbi:MAG: class I SAM-dependent methyltransferase [Alphaproteobacteria bacterium]|nr:class I SAM-dependent methyltransferase [Alphaproteobacteria bacterium]
MADRKDHWRDVYATKRPDEVSWFEAVPSLSHALVTRHLSPGAPFVDVGGGASRLVDLLLGEGYGPLSVLDISEPALAACRGRLGAAAGRVDWILADVTRWEPERDYALWHDRAAFHFLAEIADRTAYVRALTAALRPGGIAIIATFAEDGPEKCSGLPVQRYAPEALAAELARLAPDAFEPVEHHRHSHQTPEGREQRFQVSVFRRAQPAGAGSGA